MNGFGSGAAGPGGVGGYDFATAYNPYESLLNDTQQNLTNNLAASANSHSSPRKTSSPNPLRQPTHHHSHIANNHYPSTVVGGYGHLADMYQLLHNRPDSLTYDPMNVGNGSSTNGRSSTTNPQHRLFLAPNGVAGAATVSTVHEDSHYHRGVGATGSALPQNETANNVLAALFMRGDNQSFIQHDQFAWLGANAGPSSASAAASSSSSKTHQQQQASNISAYLQQYPHLISASFLDHHATNSSLSGAVSSLAPNPYPHATVSNQSSRQSSKAEETTECFSLFSPPVLGPEETWLAEMTLIVPELSLKELSGVNIEERIRNNMHDVITRYVPCVDFLVQCQQELRKGLDYANQPKRTGSRRSRASTTQQTMTPTEFFTTYVDHLPKKFYNANALTMTPQALEDGYHSLIKLRDDARNCQRQTSEAVKNNFLGGMKDGESWGLRKWLSKHGNALAICTDLECILKAIKQLDKSDPSTSKLASIIRPMAKIALDKLHKDIPPSYQQRSTAHPYLPFFHRLEAALQNMSSFDPDEDDVICLDDSDDDDDDVVVEMVKSEVTTGVEKCILEMNEQKQEKAVTIDDTPPRTNNSSKRKHIEMLLDDDDDDNEDDEDNIGSSPYRQRQIQQQPTNDNANPMNHFTATTITTGRPLVNNCTHNNNDDSSSSGESDDESVVQIIETRVNQDDSITNGLAGRILEDWVCELCCTNNPGVYILCHNCHQAPVGGATFSGGTTGPTANYDIGSTTAGAATLFDCGSSMDSSMDQIFHGTNDFNSKLNDTFDASSLVVNGHNLAGLGNPQSWPLPPTNTNAAIHSALGLSRNLVSLAQMFDQQSYPSIRPVQVDSGSFWIGSRFADALRLFASILSRPEAIVYLEHIDDDSLIKVGQPPFSHIIKHPICFRDIVTALICEGNNTESKNNNKATNHDKNLSSSESGGVLLSNRGLKKWNMWIGDELIQAIDLVLLNSLAYSKHLKQGKSPHRSKTNEMRKDFWKGVTDIVTTHVDNDKDKKRYTPTRRCESSGFVVYKINET
jgi:hypothetical protein